MAYIKNEGEKMYLIVGLGNPENEYSNTRHNMGFDTINEIAKKNNISVTKAKFQGIYETGIIQGKKVILLKPQTYMNLSGKSIREFVDFYNIHPEEIIVIYDDIDTEKGNIRIRKKGSAGSHNGMKSVIQELNTTDFARIRVGIGQPEFKNDMINYVIGKVPQEEQKVLIQGVKKAADAVEEIIKNGIDIAMNKFN
jgi:PTH1 family peptidyl-tRNA hydrolase